MDMSELVPCPFDIHHQVSRKKLQYHIVKCLKNYKGRKVACPYNATEYIEPEELKEHLLTCESMAERAAHTYHLFQSRTRDFVEAPFYHHDLPAPTEKWGLE